MSDHKHMIGATISYHKAQVKILISLNELTSALQNDLKTPFKYRFISAAQATPVQNALYSWKQSGEVGPQPFFEPGAFRSVIYSQAGAAKQIQAFLNVSRVLIFELCQSAIRGFEANEIAVPLMLLRGLIERIANAAALADELKDLGQAIQPRAQPSKSLLELADKIGKALYGTQVDWMSLANTDLRTASKKENKYTHKEMTMDVSARQVLGLVDKLGRRIPGIRNAYDVLCEFLHPNVGDLYSATMRASSFFDDFRTRHVIRELGVGPKKLESSSQLDEILSQVLSICIDAMQILPKVHDELHGVSIAANKMSKNLAHRIRKKHREYFRNNDLCPCLSGLKIRDCK